MVLDQRAPTTSSHQRGRRADDPACEPDHPGGVCGACLGRSGHYCSGKEARAYTLPEPGAPAIPVAQPRWRRAEGLFLGTVTLLAALFSLGTWATQSPQNLLDAAGRHR